MSTNEYFAVSLILRLKTKLTASASVLLVPIVDKKDFSLVNNRLRETKHHG